MKRGEVWWAELQEPVGSGPGFRRPVVIVQSNPFNDSRVTTVIVAAITSNLGVADAPGNLRISKIESGLSKPSVINVSQMLTVDRELLVQRVKMLPGQIVTRMDDGLRLALAL